MEHLGKIFLGLVILIGGYFWYDRWAAKNDSEDRMEKVLTLIESTNSLPKSTPPHRAGEGMYKVLAMLRRFETNEDIAVGALLDDLFNRAVDEGRIKNDEVQALRGALRTNMQICDDFDVFKTDGMALLEAGRAPTIRSGPFKGEELIIGHLVPPSLAPEAKNYFGNMILTPESVFALQTDEVDIAMKRSAGSLREARALSSSAMSRVNNRERDARAYRVGETN